MWILSQNKERLLEAKYTILVRQSDDGKRFDIFGGASRETLLGTYNSKTKAKKVLIEIAEQLRSAILNIDKNEVLHINYPEVIFEMPGDDE